MEETNLVPHCDQRLLRSKHTVYILPALKREASVSDFLGICFFNSDPILGFLTDRELDTVLKGYMLRAV